MKLLSLFVILLFQSHAFAADLVSCRSDGGDQLESHLRIYLTSQGYAFEVSACQTPSPAALTASSCQSYELSGLVDRQKISRAGQVFETMHFSNDRVDIVPYYGGFLYKDGTTSQVVEFDRGDCDVAPNE